MTLDDIDLESLYAYPPHDDVWVRTNFVTTLDGAAQDRSGLTAQLGGDDDTRVFALLRSMADVIVVGAATARTEGYEPVKPHEVDGGLRARLGLRELPPIAVASNSLEIPRALLASGQIVITHESAPLRQLDPGEADVITAGSSQVDWPVALALLQKRGYRRILCEGGPTLHGCLIAADLVDELCLTIAPLLASGGAPRIAHALEPAYHPMRLAHSRQAGDVLLTRWIRRRSD